VDVYELLARELGPDRVLRDEVALETYSQDESRLGRFLPDAAVVARSREEIEIALRLAAEHGIPVTPRGAGSGMTGGALPVRGGLVLSTEAMRTIKLIVHPRLVLGLTALCLWNTTAETRAGAPKRSPPDRNEAVQVPRASSKTVDVLSGLDRIGFNVRQPNYLGEDGSCAVAPVLSLEARALCLRRQKRKNHVVDRFARSNDGVGGCIAEGDHGRLG
jgi:hypothetical protein